MLRWWACAEERSWSASPAEDMWKRWKDAAEHVWMVGVENEGKIYCTIAKRSAVGREPRSPLSVRRPSKASDGSL